MQYQLDNIENALASGDEDLFNNIPHVDLHCHSITSAPFSAFQELSSAIVYPPKKFSKFEDFNLYLQRNIKPIIKDFDTIRFLLQKTFQRLIGEGIIYTEMSFDLNLPEYLDKSIEEYLELIKEEKEKIASKLKVVVEIGLDREKNPEKQLSLLKRALRRKIIGSIDLYGNELSVSVKNFIDHYKLADKFGLKLKAHIGEQGSAKNITETIKLLKLQAIQHGIRAADDAQVMEYLSKKGIVLNICPTSNIAFGLAKSRSDHPLRKLFDNNITITIGSDDFTIFNQSVAAEYLTLFREKIFKFDELKKIIINGLDQIPK